MWTSTWCFVTADMVVMDSYVKTNDSMKYLYVSSLTHMSGLSFQFQYLVWIIWGLATLFVPNDCSFRQETFFNLYSGVDFPRIHVGEGRLAWNYNHVARMDSALCTEAIYIYILYTRVCIPICNDNLKELNRTWLSEKSKKYLLQPGGTIEGQTKTPQS